MMTVTLELPDDLAEKLLSRPDKNNFATAALRGAINRDIAALRSLTLVEYDALVAEMDAEIEEIMADVPPLPEDAFSRESFYEGR